LYAERYFKKLSGRKDVEDALQRLDKLTQEEARMAAAESLTITRGIAERLEGVDDRVRVVDHNVIEGEFYRVSMSPNMSSIFPVGVKETGAAIQRIVNQVSDLKCSWWSNLTANHKGLTSLTGNVLRKDLRKWIAPPDPSVNYNVASSAHYEGTASWCTGGNTLADWKTTGSLLWIHGKRACRIAF
jgi:hypothetical protein